MKSIGPATVYHNLLNLIGLHFRDFVFTPAADGYVWEIPAGPATIRYTAVIQGDAWHEVGDRVMPGQDPVRFFEMNLKREGDTDWPAVGPGRCFASGRNAGHEGLRSYAPLPPSVMVVGPPTHFPIRERSTRLFLGMAEAVTRHPPFCIHEPGTMKTRSGCQKRDDRHAARLQQLRHKAYLLYW
jgi:hypothetical protein